MTSVLLIWHLFHLISTENECTYTDDNTIGDLNLTPGLFFPNNNNTTQESNNQGNTNNQYPMTNQTYSTNPNGNSIYPNQQNTNSNNYLQPNNNYSNSNLNSYALTCDNSLDREKFKKCIADALRTLRNILENCRKTLGHDAKECQINQECLDELMGNNQKSKEKDLHENKDTLSEFLEFLERKLERRNRNDDDQGNEREYINNKRDEYDNSRERINDYREDYSDSRESRNLNKKDRNKGRGSRKSYGKRNREFDDKYLADEIENYQRKRKNDYKKRGCKDPCDMQDDACDQCRY
ncbi:hypothetical protein GVAV_000158 [Gurleya vavrai]